MRKVRTLAWPVRSRAPLALGLATKLAVPWVGFRVRGLYFGV